MLNIIGGSYMENCIDPSSNELYGSGLRAAAALSNKGFNISFYSCISKEYQWLAEQKGKTFGYQCTYLTIPLTIEFDYYHPLSFPYRVNYEEDLPIQKIIVDREGDFLYYGMLEAVAIVNGNYVVYDPQNQKRFKDTGSTAKHLAIILNKKEALFFSKTKNEDLHAVGCELLESENADVIVIKNGADGALVFDKEGIHTVPVFQTSRVWPIGSGDVFSAVFSWQWIMQKKSPHESALYASMMTAHYCESKHLPVVEPSKLLSSLEVKKKVKSIYLAGPFFTMAERWLINELRDVLIDFGNNVFSPYHDVGIVDASNINSESKAIAEKDLDGLINCDVVLAVISGLDAGTLFEIGYAKANDKKVVVLSQNVNSNDLTMLIGTECEITDDFTTAVYKASW